MQKHLTNNLFHVSKAGVIYILQKGFFIYAVHKSLSLLGALVFFTIGSLFTNITEMLFFDIFLFYADMAPDLCNKISDGI